MISVVKKYLSLILLLIILLLLPFEWYKQLYANKTTFILEDANGVFVFTQLHWVIAIIYFYSVLLQYISIIYKNFLLGAFTNFILAISLTVFPMNVIKLTGQYILSRFDYGYYLALAIIIGSIVINIRNFITNRRVQ